MTGLETPHARPKAVKSKNICECDKYMINSQYKPCFDLIKTYGTFLSSHNNGKCNKISRGSASAAQTMNSEIPLFNVLVAVNYNTDT